MADALRKALGYTFTKPDLLVQALTHRSFGSPHNERLEFIGDAVLNCVVAETLFARFPALPEGDLSRVRAALVNRDTLARVAEALDVGAAVRLGDGELKSGGSSRPSIIADALEAIFGAVFVDGGYESAQRVIVVCYAGVLRDADPVALGKDPKTRLQEWLQGRKLPVPDYVVVATAGQAHAQHFTVECRIPALDLTTIGEGASRRTAEQEAAEAAYLQGTTNARREPQRAG